MNIVYDEDRLDRNDARLANRDKMKMIFVDFE